MTVVSMVSQKNSATRENVVMLNHVLLEHHGVITLKVTNLFLSYSSGYKQYQISWYGNKFGIKSTKDYIWFYKIRIRI